MPVDTEKRNKRQNQWIKENTDRINVIFPKGIKNRIAAVADLSEKGKPKISEFIRDAVLDRLLEKESHI